jgi:hypothetical protein
MLDKLSLTIDKLPDKKYLEDHGIIREAKRDKFYKFSCELDNVVIFFVPHKFDSITNSRITVSKIDTNPKYFENFGSMRAVLSNIIRETYECPEMCKITRIDAAADIEDLLMELMLASLHIKKIVNLSTFKIIKGTIYAGSDPQFRIYDKIKQL